VCLGGGISQNIAYCVENCSKIEHFSISGSRVENLQYTTQQLDGQQELLICRFGTNWGRGKNLGRLD